MLSHPSLASSCVCQYLTVFVLEGKKSPFPELKENWAQLWCEQPGESNLEIKGLHTFLCFSVFLIVFLAFARFVLFSPLCISTSLLRCPPPPPSPLFVTNYDSPFCPHSLLSCLLFFYCFPSSLPLLSAADPERGGPLCGGWGKADAVRPRRATPPHGAGPQPGVADGFLPAVSAAVEHRRARWNRTATVQGGESADARLGGFLLAHGHVF